MFNSSSLVVYASGGAGDGFVGVACAALNIDPSLPTCALILAQVNNVLTPVAGVNPDFTRMLVRYVCAAANATIEARLVSNADTMTTPGVKKSMSFFSTMNNACAPAGASNSTFAVLLYVGLTIALLTACCFALRYQKARAAPSRRGLPHLLASTSLLAEDAGDPRFRSFSSGSDAGDPLPDNEPCAAP